MQQVDTQQAAQAMGGTDTSDEAPVRVQRSCSVSCGEQFANWLSEISANDNRVILILNLNGQNIISSARNTAIAMSSLAGVDGVIRSCLATDWIAQNQQLSGTSRDHLPTLSDQMSHLLYAHQLGAKLASLLQEFESLYPSPPPSLDSPNQVGLAQIPATPCDTDTQAVSQ